MDFFGSMEIDPTCEFSSPQSRFEGISFYGFSASPRFHATKTHSGHFVVRTLREEYGPNFADAVGGAFRSWIWPRSFETA